MYRVAVKDHIMIAHSLRGKVFGPAQNLHGATYIVTTEYASPELGPDGIVVDIGLAMSILGEVLEPLNYANLDELPQLRGCNTTTEFLANHVFGKIAERIADTFRGSLKVTLEESHVAWASYEGKVGTS
jgi:6-pyruvoyl-tetrahydropterin synthase